MLSNSFSPVKGELRISEVSAYSVRLWQHTNQGGLPIFKSDDDAARRHYHGPFAQLVSAIVAVIRTDEGITGFGLGGGGRVAVEIIDGHLRNLLVGTNPLNVDMLWEQLYLAGSYYGRRGVFVMALSALDNALWDIIGKFTSKPVYRLIGLQPKKRILGYKTDGNIKKALNNGFQHFKVNPPCGFADGSAGIKSNLETLGNVRDLIGPNCTLMIDCSARWENVEYTLEMARRLQAVNLHWIEEPLFPDDLEGYARLVREMRGPLIASGEHEYTQYGFSELIRRNAVQVLQPDVTWSGGVTAVRKIAKMAADDGLSFCPHRGGSLYGLPIALNSGICPFVESFGTGDDGTEIMNAITAPFKDGYYYPSDEPGFGTGLNEEMIQEYRL
ncbi:MAG: L-rhamnonate dehydratase [Candidatus Moanabacter tarae]|uniref:L-rhamnonate dehydratase n=1 Tax=Candidatus Moanibacter tarae TaxID=2200854 RepID=A0A2Z4AHN5_9BACT|nr:MAG: L-rhamnonate dehydratase [Candidatus Moanabacter tarae]